MWQVLFYLFFFSLAAWPRVVVPGGFCCFLSLAEERVTSGSTGTVSVWVLVLVLVVDLDLDLDLDVDWVVVVLPLPSRTGFALAAPWVKQGGLRAASA